MDKQKEVTCTYNGSTLGVADASSRLTVGKTYKVLKHLPNHAVRIVDDLGDTVTFNMVRFNETGKRWTENLQKQ